MRLKRLIGIGLVVISSLSAGYMLGGIINTYLPNTIAQISIFLVMFCGGIYLIVKNGRYLVMSYKIDSTHKGNKSDYPEKPNDIG